MAFSARRARRPGRTRVRANAAEFLVTASCRPLAPVVMGLASEEPKYECNMLILAAFGLSRAAVDAELEAGGRHSGERAAWC